MLRELKHPQDDHEREEIRLIARRWIKKYSDNPYVRVMESIFKGDSGLKWSRQHFYGLHRYDWFQPTLGVGINWMKGRDVSDCHADPEYVFRRSGIVSLRFWEPDGFKAVVHCLNSLGNLKERRQLLRNDTGSREERRWLVYWHHDWSLLDYYLCCVMHDCEDMFEDVIDGIVDVWNEGRAFGRPLHRGGSLVAGGRPGVEAGGGADGSLLRTHDIPGA